MTNDNEVFISIDVETAGPIPSEYSLLSIGACLVDDPAQTFSCQIAPTTFNADPAALGVSGLSLKLLKEEGESPSDAMRRFASWIEEASRGAKPVFVGFNAPFDWSFVNYYFHRFAGGNPFGFTALDIKALWMGVADCRWSETTSRRIAERLQPRLHGDHDALHDAQYQAELFRLVRAERRR